MNFNGGHRKICFWLEASPFKSMGANTGLKAGR
jgi:hypothetical protein